MSLEAEIESLWADYRDGAIDADSADADDLDTLDSFLTGLEAGEIRAAEKRQGYFVNGKRTDPSWEGGVVGPDVAEWQGVREL